MQIREMEETRRASRSGMRALAVAATLLAAGVAGVWTAQAADAAPVFEVTTTKTPTSFRIGDQAANYTVTATNTGDAVPDGTAATLKVTLPSGVSVRHVNDLDTYHGVVYSTCDVTGQTVTCTGDTEIGSYRTMQVGLAVSVGDDAADGGKAAIEVSGGGLPAPVTQDDPFTILPRHSFGVNGFVAGTVDSAGTPDAVAPAGSHPFAANASFAVNSVVDVAGLRAPVEPLKDVVTDLPVGFVGNPQAIPTCKVSQLLGSKCPIESQVGVIRVDLVNSLVPPPVQPYGIYNMAPDRGNVAQFGASIQGIGIVHLVASVRSDDDFGVRLTVRNIPTDPVTQSVAVSLWGVPADPAHDSERFMCFFGLCFPGASSTAPVEPFLSNPHECLPNPPVTKLSVDSWQNPGEFKTFESVAAPLKDCDKPTFEPSVDVKPSTPAPDAPSGLNVDMNFPTEDNAEGLAPPPLKKATVTLPEGMTINPSGANGLKACTDDELKLKSKDPITCPNEAKVGTATATSPVLAEKLTGGVYIRSQNSDDPESGEMFRIALVLENEERGLSIRLPGSIRANKDTGRLETTFDNNPQLPVSNINLQFKDGPRAPLASPPTCGEKTVNTQLTSWSGKTVDRQNSFTVDCVPNLGGFSPTFKAGAVDPTAGASSPFTLGISKPDGNADLNGLRLELPKDCWRRSRATSVPGSVRPQSVPVPGRSRSGCTVRSCSRAATTTPRTRCG